MIENDFVAPYAPAIIKLLKGILYEDDSDWDMLLNNERNIKEYFGKIGVTLYLDEAEGYAYLQQPDREDDDEQAKPLPRLVTRYPLTRDVTLLCVLLREELLEFDASTSNSTRCILSKDKIHDLMRPFFKEQTNDVQLVKKFDSSIAQAVKLHFLKELKGTESEYEVRRILKAKFSADKLKEIEEELKSQDKSNA